jgi:hypothetical protein
MWDFSTGQKLAEVSPLPVTLSGGASAVPGADKLYYIHPLADRITTWKSFTLPEFLAWEDGAFSGKREFNFLRIGPQGEVVVLENHTALNLEIYTDLAQPPKIIEMPARFTFPLQADSTSQSPGRRYLVNRIIPPEEYSHHPKTYWVFDLQVGSIAGGFKVRGQCASVVRFSPDGKELAVWYVLPSGKCAVALIDLASGKAIVHDSIFQSEKVSVSGHLHWSPDSTRLLYHIDDAWIVFDKRTKKAGRIRPPADAVVLFDELLASRTTSDRLADVELTRWTEMAVEEF